MRQNCHMTSQAARTAEHGRARRQAEADRTGRRRW
jgi:hypothetical protein